MTFATKAEEEGRLEFTEAILRGVDGLLLDFARIDAGVLYGGGLESLPSREQRRGLGVHKNEIG